MTPTLNRRSSLRLLTASAACILSRNLFSAERAQPIRPNILLITADDMNYDSLGINGCTSPGITPNIDRLASQGMRFEHAHVTIAVCQPCRSCLMTGRYPHQNGAEGFEPIRRDVPTLTEELQRAGYRNGILGKVEHLKPDDKFCWDYVRQYQELGYGRVPTLYGQYAREFFNESKRNNQPFFLMANSHDPHRPFAGSEQERNKATKSDEPFTIQPTRRTYRADEITVPGFLPDIPDVRREIAEYYTSVHRCDETVGAILNALEETKLQDNTLVMFLSDHGIRRCRLPKPIATYIARAPHGSSAGPAV